jgi:ribose transport system substrate-binding protein
MIRGKNMATIKDIANAAGVSVATVSHVVNNTRFVSPELRKRVEEAIANAETPPNFVVKKKMQEKERKKNKMLMEEQKAIVADAGPEFYLYLTSSPFAHFDSSVEQKLRKLAGEQGCELVRVSIESEGMLEFLTCSLINSSKMKGIFVTASVATEKLSEILNSVSVPVVIIGNSIPGVACDRVSTANEEGAYKATMHLIRSGHENIAILCGSEDREFNRERIEGYKRALRDNQIPIQDQYIVDDLKGKVSVKIALDKLLNDVHQPSAIFVANLDTIYHVYNYISEHEIECPKDLSVVCFNDFSWATLINPPTTTVKQDVDQICKEAFLCIQDRIKEIQTQSEKSEAKTILLPNQLCVRRSTSGIGRGPFGERAGDISDLVLTEEPPLLLMMMIMNTCRNSLVKVQLQHFFLCLNSMDFLKHWLIIDRDKRIILSPEKRCVSVSDFIADICRHFLMSGSQRNTDNFAWRCIYHYKLLIICVDHIILIQTSGKNGIIHADSHFCSFVCYFFMYFLKCFVPFNIYIFYCFSCSIKIMKLS